MIFSCERGVRAAFERVDEAFIADVSQAKLNGSFGTDLTSWSAPEVTRTIGKRMVLTLCKITGRARSSVA